MKRLGRQMQVQLPSAGETFEVLQDLFDGPLDADRDASRRACLGGKYSRAAAHRIVRLCGGFLPQRFVHAVQDHRQFELVESSLDAEHHPVLGVGRVVQPWLVGQQHVFEPAEPHQLCPVLIVANKAGQFACGDQSGLVGDDRCHEHLEIDASMLRAACLASIAVQQDDLRPRPTERGDMLDHGLLPSLSFRFFRTCPGLLCADRRKPYVASGAVQAEGESLVCGSDVGKSIVSR